MLKRAAVNPNILCNRDCLNCIIMFLFVEAKQEREKRVVYTFDVLFNPSLVRGLHSAERSGDSNLDNDT